MQLESQESFHTIFKNSEITRITLLSENLLNLKREY